MGHNQGTCTTRSPRVYLHYTITNSLVAKSYGAQPRHLHYTITNSLVAKSYGAQPRHLHCTITNSLVAKSYGAQPRHLHYTKQLLTLHNHQQPRTQKLWGTTKALALGHLHYTITNIVVKNLWGTTKALALHQNHKTRVYLQYTITNSLVVKNLWGTTKALALHERQESTCTTRSPTAS